MEQCKVCGDILDGNGHESKTGGLVCHVCVRDEQIGALRSDLDEANAHLAMAREDGKRLQEELAARQEMTGHSLMDVVIPAIIRLSDCLLSDHPDSPTRGTVPEMMDAAVARIESLRHELAGLQNKFAVAVDMAAHAANELAVCQEALKVLANGDVSWENYVAMEPAMEAALAEAKRRLDRERKTND